MQEKFDICNGAFKVWDRGDRHAEISTAIKPTHLFGHLLAAQHGAFGRPLHGALVVRTAIIGFVVSDPVFDASLDYPDCSLGSAFPGRLKTSGGPLHHVDGLLVADIHDLENMLGKLPRATHAPAVA
ncbi:hypothetical protein D3C71_188950 [compost metagenome]